MDVKQSYNIWAEQYDTDENKTRDLEAVSLKETVPETMFENCLEIGCGTGKNTVHLLTKAKHITAVDFSEEMLNKAKEKIRSEEVIFIKYDITEDWNFADRKYDLITFSLVLEHIENLNQIYLKISEIIKPGGYVYFGELHPFRQYNGTKARFEKDNSTHILKCFNHSLSDFIQPALKYGFEISDLREYYDDNDRAGIPRILAILLRKK